MERVTSERPAGGAITETDAVAVAAAAADDAVRPIDSGALHYENALSHE